MEEQKKDYYELLEIPRDASGEEVRRAYRRKALEYHPDRNKSSDAAQRFKEINEAYQTLTDPDQRGAYDRFGHVGVKANGAASARGFDGHDPFAGFGDIFEAFFGDVGVHAGARPHQGSDQFLRLTLSFQEAVFGATKEVEVTRVGLCQRCQGAGAEPGTSGKTCGTCRGTGQVRRVQQSIFGQFAHITTCTVCQGEGIVVSSPCTRCRGAGREQGARRLQVHIPGGVDNGTQVRLTGEGDSGLHGGSPGDLYVELVVEPHPSYRRQGDDLLYVLPLNISQAALGDVVTITTLDGDVETVKFTPGTQTGTTFRIKAKGVPRLHRGGRGDLVVVANVVIPKRLTRHQRQLLEELAQTLGEPQEDGAHEGTRDTWFDRVRDALGGKEP